MAGNKPKEDLEAQKERAKHFKEKKHPEKQVPHEEEPTLMGSMQWADYVARKVIEEHGDKKKYTVASGITPSGVVHIGNFREVITVDLVARALRAMGKEVRFIYSWDDYDVFRKIPKDMPKQEELAKFLRKPIVDTPDPFGCHKSYAEHFEKELEVSLPEVGIVPEYIYQHQKYRKCVYAEEIRTAMRAREKIRKILDEFREEPLEKEWLPLSAYCPKCGIDEVQLSEYDEEYSVRLKCECGFEDIVDFRKCGFIKLPWRIDWPMRWHYEHVDFEPGGKDHSTLGGSRDTGQRIIQAVWNEKAPVYQRYDFISVKGGGGKMSSSLGNLITLKDVLEIYEPELARYLFCGTRPNREFAISFDLDVLKIYSDYEKIEQAYYGKIEIADKNELAEMKRTYELSAVDKPAAKMPAQFSLRNMINAIQICNGDLNKAMEYFKLEIKDEADKKRFISRAQRMKNWIEKYAPDELKFTLQEKVFEGIKLSDAEKGALKHLAKLLFEKEWNEESLFAEFYKIAEQFKLKVPDFFKASYLVLLNKERGPKLAGIILAIGQKKVASLFEKV